MVCRLKRGGAFLYYGAPIGCNNVADATLNNTQPLSYMGTLVNSAGDVNGDGFGDVIVSAPNYTNMQSQEGAAYIYHGSAIGLSANPAAIVESNVASGALGGAASSAGDVNGDGYSGTIIEKIIVIGISPNYHIAIPVSIHIPSRCDRIAKKSKILISLQSR